jgi:hypothetical protein
LMKQWEFVRRRGERAKCTLKPHLYYENKRK